MRKLLLIALLALAACADRTDFAGFARIWTDPDTGCQYVVTAYSYGGGVTPRMNADGTQRCVSPEARDGD